MSTTADVCITEFTDPGCPWAWSAEPFRLRLSWLYGDGIEWRPRMVVLAEDPQEYLDKGFTPDKLRAGLTTIAREHGMPIDTSLRPRMAATAPACRAIVATRLHVRASERAILRALRRRCMAGELLDEAATVRHAAADAGLDPDAVLAWSAEPATELAMRGDMAAAREPIAAARVLDERLANWSGGRRYTCPSYEIVRRSDGVRIAVPGFQPFAAYDVVLANLVPGTERREAPESVLEVLAWAGAPLATREVAVVCDIDHATAREELGRVADEAHVGADGFWSPR
ncbi:MAG TPA: DsbA family protein [Solirubrobacteraceae bacterium]|nr:DsbA family protein [Solirubrobacteraceae bacterium]